MQTDTGLLFVKEIDPTKDSQIGKVISKGEKVTSDISVGDMVVYCNRTIMKNMERYNANEIKSGEDTLVFVDYTDIYAIIDDI